jgi:hypothetical protein
MRQFLEDQARLLRTYEASVGREYDPVEFKLGSEYVQISSNGCGISDSSITKFLDESYEEGEI